MNIIIPARKGSKGLPGKNRLLLMHTLSEIPAEYHKKVIVSTDDEFILQNIRKNYSQCQVHSRSKESASDTASTKKCIEETVRDFSLAGNIIMLYLTYPNRKWETVMKAYSWFVDQNASSLLCKEPLKSHPYLCMLELPNNRGKQIVEHDLYRRQDYPKCFRLSHAIAIFKTDVIEDLNSNLYNEDTIYYEIRESLDVDTPEDFERLKRKRK